MSELRTFNSERIYWAVEQVEREAGDIADLHLDDTLFCLKSEVDNIFHRLKARLARKGISNQRLEADNNNNWRKYCCAIDEISHHKYKRCLDKAKWCDERIARYSLQQEIQGISWKKEMEFYRRLRDKYLELAEKFKEVK